MTEVPKKRGRKSNAEKAAILAAQEQARAGEQAKDDCEHVQASNCGSENRPTGALPDHETQGLIAEALWAHDMQDESVRFDSRNRKWTFRPDSRDNRASLAIICKRGPDERELLISNVRFGADSVRDEVVAMIELLDGELS